MRFSTIHRLCSYLLVACGILPLALSRELEPLLVALLLAGGGASYFFEPARSRIAQHRLWVLGWNTSAIVVLLLCGLEAWFVEDAVVRAGVHLLCFLVLNKLWNRFAAKDYLQTYALSLAMLVAGTLLNVGLIYAVAFIGYVVLATWALTLLHLRREMEESHLLKHSGSTQSERVAVDRIMNSRRIIGPSFLAGSAVVALGIFAGSTIIFLVFPRVDFGLFGRRRPGVMTTGFSDRIELGHHGLIKDNPQVVMRVEFTRGARPAAPLYFRGIAFDTYSNGQWKQHPSTERVPLVRQPGGAWLLTPELGGPVPEQDQAPLAGTLKQEIYLEPIDTFVLFGVSQPVAFVMPPARPGLRYRLETGGHGEVQGALLNEAGRPLPVTTGRRYTVYTLEPRMPVEGSPDTDLDAAQAEELAPYLEVPANLPARVRELGRTVTKGARGPRAKADAIARHLRSRYRYTLQLKRDEHFEPLEDFLFVQRAGHCEYFASAMAILLRSVGVPTRSVNGFYGGEWNTFGDYLAVRQGDAHAWVEVYLPGSGWVTYDPTPPLARSGSRRSMLDTMRMLFDTVQLAWFKYVVEYDLGKQIDLFSALNRWLRGDPRTQRNPGATRKWSWPRPQRSLLIVLLVVAGGAVLWRYRRRWWSRRPAAAQLRVQREALRALERALRALALRRLQRGSAETLLELGRRATAAGDPGAAPFVELVTRYYDARFGAHPCDPVELARLAAAVVTPPQSSPSHTSPHHHASRSP